MLLVASTNIPHEILFLITKKFKKLGKRLRMTWPLHTAVRQMCNNKQDQVDDIMKYSHINHEHWYVFFLFISFINSIK